jgi:phosphatidylserine/phosphatidylglycerophosphate/cardiolipin synthase-like enzyme
MRRLLVPVVVGPLVVGIAAALAGCHGVKVDLAASPTASSHSGKSDSSGKSGGSGSAGTASTVQAAGPVSAGSGSLRVLSEPQAGLSAIYALINGAKSSVDLTMYELIDTTAENDLTAAAKRGVDVRVILDAHLEKSRNTTTYDYLKAHKVHVTWAPSGVTYHQKTLTVDNKTSAIMTLNMTSEDYGDTRDFAVIDTSRADVAAVVATFNADFSHKKVTPPDGADLVWSPTNSQAAILAVIGAARHNLAVENEEMGDTVITSALEAAAKRGVDVTITMTAESDWDSAFSALAKAGAHVRTYKDSTKVLYIHAKAVVADAGSSAEQMFVGSENFSSASLRRNRELGIRTTNKPVISAVAAVLAADYAGATPYR